MSRKNTISEVNQVLASLHEAKFDLRKMNVISAYERVDGAINWLKSYRDRLAKEDADDA